MSISIKETKGPATGGPEKGAGILVTKRCRTKFGSEKTGNKMIKSQVLRIRV